MCIGLAVGGVIALIFSFNYVLGMILGMCIGLIGGMCVKVAK